jgi:DNA repair exonuclease SbcCD nuclease subunit
MFQGCVVGSEDTMMAAGVQMLPRNLGVNTIFSGHIHKPQRLVQDGCADVWHPGSPASMDFGERFDTKEFLDVSILPSGISISSVPIKFQRRFVQLDSLDVSLWPDIKDAIVKVDAEVEASVDSAEIENELIKRGAHSVASIRVRTKVEVTAMNYGSAIVDDKILMAQYLREQCANEEDFQRAWQLAWSSIGNA